MLKYSRETSHQLIHFLKKNVYIAISQAEELSKIAVEKKLTELDVLLKMFPENEEKVSEILQKLHSLKAQEFSIKSSDQILRAQNFLLLKRENGENLFLCYDPQSLIDYYNFLQPNTVILPYSEFNELYFQDIKEAEKEDLSAFSISSNLLEIQDIKDATKEELSEKQISEDAVRQLDNIIKKSISNDASDVHIEVDSSHEGRLYYRVRLRVDGVLKEIIRSDNMEVFSGILSQVKLKAGLKLDENRLPQDGRLNYSVMGKMYSFRISTKPVIVYDVKNAGAEEQREKIVIRKMPDVNSLQLDNLGINEYNKKVLLSASAQAHGFNIVTGPTGSGKTTLLYALLRSIDSKTKNISTIEDPVEAELKNINQTQVQPEISLDFARVLRAELRQDPDIIMVGEMRDKQTAEIAAEASLTGHLVFSTLHTKNAVSSITRLVNMGLPKFIVSSSLSYCIAQRLIRKLCPHCKVLSPNQDKIRKDFIDPVMKGVMHHSLSDYLKPFLKNFQVYEASKSGCDKCLGLAYQGRTAILEVFKLNEEAKDIILKKDASELLLQEIAVKKGMMTMEQDGILKVMQGISSFDELYKVLVSH